MRRMLLLTIALGIVAMLGFGALAAPPAPAANQSVTIIDFAFQPQTRTIAPGDTVIWTNSGAQDHTATSDTAVWDSGTITPTSSFAFTFLQTGSFPYHCTFHSSMTGTIVVAEPTVTPSATSTAAQYVPIIQRDHNSAALTATADSLTATAEGASSLSPRSTPTATPTATRGRDDPGRAAHPQQAGSRGDGVSRGE